MAPIQPSASNFGSIAATGLGLRYTGKHAYAYNTAVPSTTAATIIKFTTGNFYILADITLYGAVGIGSTTILADGTIAGLNIDFNSTPIGVLKVDSETVDQPISETFNVLIPSYTEVEMEILTRTQGGNKDSMLVAVGIVGRVYGAE